jgi:serine/threonine protein phosphatase PrpC
MSMPDPANPKAGGLWARLFSVDADDEPGAVGAELARADSAGPAPVAQEPAENWVLGDDDEAGPPPEEGAPTEQRRAQAAAIAEVPEADLAQPPAPGPEPCPACATPRKPGAKFCDDCGWMFANDAAPARASAPSASIATSRAKAMPAASTSRLQGRYESRAQVNERLGVTRCRGFDHQTARPVTIVAAAVAPVAEVLPEATIEDTLPDALAEEIMPGFDDVSLAAVTDAPGFGAWPTIAWEKDLLARAVHPAVPEVLDHFVENDTEYLVLSAPAGRDLWDAWDDPDFDANTRYGWLEQVAEGLHALHQAGAILEGIRPDLITITPGKEGKAGGGQAVIHDLSDLLPVPLPPSPPIRATLYTAPELIVDQENVDARSDLYSFGAMLYALEYLHHTLEDKDFERQFVPLQITERFPDVHPLFLRLINKTFCRDLNTRFPTDEASKKDPSGFTELMDALRVCRRSFDNVRFDMAAWTTTGMVRTGNEDAFAFLHGVESRQDELHEYALILLCDGMGGYEAGEVAAALAISEMRKHLLQQPMFAALAGQEPPDEPVDLERVRRALEAALKQANREVYTAGRTPGRGRRGMGCTAEAIYIDARNVVVGHVGDSRTYHLHRGRLQQLTRDQTLVNRLVELGQLKAEEAENHPRKNELQQAIGGQPDVVVGLYQGKLGRGDWVLVCTDGLSNHITNQELEKMLTRETNNSAEEAARRLLNLVNLRGATDNATVVVVRAS